MVVRLPVILSQPARRDASTTDFVETTVALTLLIPGLDANLIGDLSTIQLGSTDHVCLLGHTRDVVVASFLELTDAQAAWQRLEQRGHFIDLTQDEADIRASLRGGNALRKVFYYQLVVGKPVDNLLDQCRKLLAAQQLSLVSIQWRPSGAPVSQGNGASIAPAGSVIAPAAASGARTLASPTSNSSSGPSSSLSSSPARSGASAGQPPAPAAAEPTPRGHADRTAQSEADERDEWSALDKLVDDLDAMDL